MTRKARVTFNESYTNKQIQDISGAGPTAISRWKKHYLAEVGGHTPQGKKALTPEQQKRQDVERQLWRAKRDNEILKKANPDYAIYERCSLFQLSESTYYAHVRPNPIKTEDAMIMTAIKDVAIETGSTYGRRRMKVALAMKGFKLGIYRTATLMKQAAVKAIRPSRTHYYPNAGKAHLIAPNLLDRPFNPEQANTHWVGDITYIRPHQGWSYLACVLDLATKEIVGWALSKSPNAELAKAALSHAIRRQQPDTAKLMFHSDQGVQYSA